MMKTTTRILASALLAAAAGKSGSGIAEETFQAEAGLTYYRTNGESSSLGRFRTQTASLDGTYFFEALRMRSGDYPLEQVVFVERAGGLSASYSRSSFDFEGFEYSKDPWGYSLMARLTPPGTPLILGAGYEYSYSGKFTSTVFDSETWSSGYRLTIGSYVDKTTAFTLDWSRNRGHARVTSGGIFPDLTGAFTSSSIGLSGQHLARLENGDHIALWAVATRNRFEQPDGTIEKTRNYYVQGTYYPTRMLGWKLAVQVRRGDEGAFLEGQGYLAGVNVFVTPAASLSLDVFRFQGETSEGDSDSVTLSFRLRF